MQRAQLARLRGEDVVTGRLISHVPRTTIDDVRQLAIYWSGVLFRVGHHIADISSRHVIDRWNAATSDVARIAQDADPRSVYEHNTDFWEAVITLAVQIASSTPSQDTSPRNAAPVDTGATIVFPSVEADDAAKMQRDEMSRQRGEDVVTDRLISRVPRTTVSDVRQLAKFWSDALLHAGGSNTVVQNESIHFADISHRQQLDRWRKALAQVAAIPKDADPNSVYEHNTDFWEAVWTIAIVIAATAAAPTRWELIKQATWKAAKNLPDTLKSAADSLWGGIWSSILAKPLITLGVGVGGVGLLYLLLRRPSSSPSSSAEIRP
jgi:hypothetical protein